MSSPALLAAAILISAAAQAQIAQPNPDLARAQKDLEELQFSDAGKWLDAAWSTPGNDRVTVLEILKLQAVVAASLGQQEKARGLFRTLLNLAPDFELPEGDLGPKVMSLYYEAKGRASVEGSLRVEPGPSARDAQRVHQVTAQVTDPLKLGKAVRFHSRPPVLSWSQSVVPLKDNQAALTVELPAVEWWAELLGEKDRVLFQLGSADQPVVVSKDASLVPEEAEPGVSFAPGSALKPAAYVVAGAGALAGIAGLVFGIRSNNWRNQILTAQKDIDGKVIGITREKALAANDELRTSATIANALFVTSVVLVGTGVGLYLAAPDVRVTASPAGVAVAGSFP